MPFRKKPLFIYANSTYTNKWNATQLFLQDESVRKWLPETYAYRADLLRTMLAKHKTVYVKPGNGTGGRSILKVAKEHQGYVLLGRNRKLVKTSARFTSVAALTAYVNKWVKQEQIRKGNFMVQEGVNLELIPDRVVDTRLLIQKDSQGEWEVTGMGVRVGGSKSSTSNLHGGGKAVSFDQFMGERFGKEHTQLIRAECYELAFNVVRSIEKKFGRMMEFGLDIGIDVDGRVWLIEVNPKPGREIFREMGQTKVYQESIRKPLEYALSLIPV